MRTRIVKVKVGGPVQLKECLAELVGCPNCTCEKFLIFKPDLVDHVHFQCVDCGVSFCDWCENAGPLTERAVGNYFSPRQQRPTSD
jgi:hypothetical protein